MVCDDLWLKGRILIMLSVCSNVSPKHDFVRRWATLPANQNNRPDKVYILLGGEKLSQTEDMLLTNKPAAR